MFTKALSLRAKLLLWLMPIILAGLVSVSSGAYLYFKSVIEEELSKSMLNSVAKSAESIDRWISTIMLEPTTFASTPAAKGINENFEELDKQNLLRHKRLHEKYPDIFKDIYAANKLGEYHTIIQDNESYSINKGNIFNRPYFQSIMNGDPTQLTPPLISRTTGIPTIFMVSPIHSDDGQPLGLIGAGISLEYIQKITQDLKTGITGYGFIVADDGTYIYHPDDSFIMKSKIIELNNPSLRKLGRRMLSGKSGIYSFSSKDREMVALYSPVAVTGWSVATVIPEAELFAPAINMVKILLAITLFFAMVVGFAIIFAMVYGIVKQNNGFIHISSELDQGTTFKIYLPRYTGSSKEHPQKYDNNDIPRGDEIILLVEDEPELLKVSEQILKELGYTVLAADYPDKAIRYAEQYKEKINLLLIDVIMPKMNGRDLATRILDRHPHMHCLFMSGYTADIIGHQGVLDEGINFLQKPFSVQTLAGKVRTVIDTDICG